MTKPDEVAGKTKPQAQDGEESLPALPSLDGQSRLGVLNGLIGFHLRMAQDASFRAFARHAGVRGLKPAHFTALMVIHNDRGITHTELARAIGRDKSSVTPLVRELEKDGLVERTQSRSDRRSVNLRLTRAGETMLRRLLARAIEHDRRMEAVIGAEKQALLRLLRMISRELG